MDNCLFCGIVRRQIPSKKVFENDVVLGFEDISPMAKKHLLFIHKKHSTNISEMVGDNTAYLADVFEAVCSYTRDEKLDLTGFRIVVNQGKDAGQTIFHTHFHLLAGEKLGSFGR